MMMKVFVLLAVVGMFFAFGCLGASPQPQSPGSGADAHGCMASAGYAWCEAAQKCILSLEENCTAAPVIVGGDKDEHGCIASAGYIWCEAKQKCLRNWEEACSPSNTSNATAVVDVNDLCSYLNGTIADMGACPNGSFTAPAPLSAGKNKTCCYTTGISLPIFGSGVDPHGCVGSTGYAWCDAKQRCLNRLMENCTDGS